MQQIRRTQHNYYKHPNGNCSALANMKSSSSSPTGLKVNLRSVSWSEKHWVNDMQTAPFARERNELFPHHSHRLLSSVVPWVARTFHPSPVCGGPSTSATWPATASCWRLACEDGLPIQSTGPRLRDAGGKQWCLWRESQFKGTHWVSPFPCETSETWTYRRHPSPLCC